MAQQANQPLPEGYQLENYRIASVLSSGGFSIVYLAYDENDQPVAIKEYLPSQLALRKEGDALPSIADENRSEEHTSELQSRRDLVCRLLLEKKKRHEEGET